MKWARKEKKKKRRKLFFSSWWQLQESKDEDLMPAAADADSYADAYAGWS